MDKNVHAGHRQRMREKYMKFGPECFSDHEFLELLLFYAIPRCNTNETAHMLLKTYGSLSGVLGASPEDLASIKGIGESAAVLITMLRDAERRILKESQSKITCLPSHDAMGEYFRPVMAKLNREHIFLMCLDSRKRILYCDRVCEGDFNSVKVDVKTIFEKVIRFDCRYVVLAHNHPSMFALPSAADNSTTMRLAEMLKSIGVTLLDHFVFAGEDYVSYYQSETLKPYLLQKTEISTKVNLGEAVE